VRQELPPLLGAEILGDERNNLAFFVVEVLVDAPREVLDKGQELSGKPRVARLRPLDHGGSKPVAGLINGTVRILHPFDLGGSARYPGRQPRPNNPVLGQMMMM